VGREEEGLVPVDWTTDGAAELISPEWRRLPLIEEVLRVELVVAVKLEGRAMDLVGSGSGRDVDDAAGTLAVGGAVIAREDRELLDRLDPHVRSEHAARLRRDGAGAHQLGAVHQVLVRLGPGAAHAEDVALPRQAGAATVVDHRRGRLQGDQLIEAAAVERE